MIIHFEILNYPNSEAEINSATQHETSSFFLYKVKNTNVDKFEDLLNILSNKSVIVKIDCEIFQQRYFVGVISTGFFSLESREALQLFELLATAPIRLEGVLFSNYNPAVEARRSGDFLIYLLHHMLAHLGSDRLK